MHNLLHRPDDDQQLNFVYQYQVKPPKKKTGKPYSQNFMLSPLLCALISNLLILLTLSAIGYWLGLFIDSKNKRLYGEHCEIDTHCELTFNLNCQNGVCNCSSKTFYNSTKMTCVDKSRNLGACSNDNHCCCDLKCVQNGASKYCSCPIDRLWNNSTSTCELRSLYNETCTLSSDCQLNAGMVCLNNKCVCSNSNMNFWNGTYCDTLQSYLGTCKTSAGCNQTQGLVCNITEQLPYRCVCPAYYYWNPATSNCIAQKTHAQSCTLTSQCKSDTGLFCDPTSANTCRCPSNYYWSTNTCVKRVSYGESCSGAIQCDTTQLLSCVSSYCVCTASRFWNGTYCVVPITSGINCDNSFSCDSTLGLTCDLTYKLCICASTQYWTGSICKTKEINGTWCTQSLQCQTQNGLSCISNRCSCETYHYWSGTKCLLKQSVNTWCTQTYQCQDYNGLVCITIGGKSTCECDNTRYWGGSQCVSKLTSYGAACTSDAECYHTLGLTCNDNICGCDKNRYWTGSTCASKVNNGLPCGASNECINDYLGVTCVNGACNCMPLMYWSGSRCEFKRSNTQACSGSNPACQDYALLTCISGTCQCNSSQYWVTNKCQNYVDINQNCDGTTYRCKAGLSCQGSSTGNYICQCATGTYWTGSTCAAVKTYNEACEEWKTPCDYSKQLKCLPSSSSTSCLTGYSGNRCTCVDTDYWDGTNCVPKKSNAVVSNVNCECRQDLGLASRAYDSTYTCYTNTSPNNHCACVNTEYWSGEKCVSKLTQADYCITDCQCKENLLLKCRAYSNAYSCYGNFGTGKMCLCEPVTQWWTGATCISRYWHLTTCGSSCQCREDKLLSCRAYVYSEHYSCMSSYSGNACVCPSAYYWLDSTSGCVLKSNLNEVCSSNCQCREDLGLKCLSIYTYSSSCTTSSSLRCSCPTTHYYDFTAGQCLVKKTILQACTYYCQCDNSLGLTCRDSSYSCYSFTGNACVCQYWEYWDGTRCQTKSGYNGVCSSNCQCRADRRFDCNLSTGRCDCFVNTWYHWVDDFCYY